MPDAGRCTGQRIAALQRLGVDVYVPRRVLAQGLASRIVTRLQSEPESTPGQRAEADDLPQPVRAADLIGASPDTGPITAEPTRPEQSVGIKGREPTASVSEPGESAGSPVARSNQGKSIAPERRSPVTERVVSFHLMTVAFSSGVVFISDIRQSPLPPVVASSAMQFLYDVARAMGRAELEEDLQPGYFQWPMGDLPGIDASAGTATDVLAGLVRRQTRDVQADCLVLMGAQASTYVRCDGDTLAGAPQVRVIRSSPLGKYFVTPALKQELWQSLQAVIR